VDEIVNTVKMISPTFGGINLEDIAAPRCFEIEAKLKNEVDIPVFHDDQHGTAIVVCAGLINALKLVKKDIQHVQIVVNGAGSAGCAIVKMLFSIGAKNIIVCDRDGIIYKGAPFNAPHMEELAKTTNLEGKQGLLADAMKESDVFIGVSAGNIVSEEMVSSMNEGAVVFAMANPTPEIMPDIAKKAGAKVVGSGRSDFANQVNNVLAFPGIFRGALNVRASDINEEMKVAAAYAIAGIVAAEELSEEYVIPNALDKRIGVEVAKAVEKAARESGVARL
jgi:malate dehydrogenase (oxaloacetate-decarboxylating)